MKKRSIDRFFIIIDDKKMESKELKLKNDDIRYNISLKKSQLIIKAEHLTELYCWETVICDYILMVQDNNPVNQFRIHVEQIYQIFSDFIKGDLNHLDLKFKMTDNKPSNLVIEVVYILLGNKFIGEIDMCVLPCDNMDRLCKKIDLFKKDLESKINNLDHKIDQFKIENTTVKPIVQIQSKSFSKLELGQFIKNVNLHTDCINLISTCMSRITKYYRKSITEFQILIDHSIDKKDIQLIKNFSFDSRNLFELKERQLKLLENQFSIFFFDKKNNVDQYIIYFVGILESCKFESLYLILGDLRDLWIKYASIPYGNILDEIIVHDPYLIIKKDYKNIVEDYVNVLLKFKHD